MSDSATGGCRRCRRLDGSVVIVTGAGSGIGRSAARLFHGEGARVVLADISDGSLQLASELGDGAIGVRADVASESDVAHMCGVAAERFGRLDVLYNNAGIAGVNRRIVDDDVSTLDQMLRVNLRSTWLGIQHAVPLMIKGGGGSIINTSASAAICGYPGLAAYASAKAGIIGLTHTAARELGGHNIRVNTLVVGATDTPLRRMRAAAKTSDELPARPRQALGRAADPMEIARVALFLASSDSSYVTGVELSVDGGFAA